PPQGHRAGERSGLTAGDVHPYATGEKSPYADKRSIEFLDLVTACHAFVAAAGRTVPGLRDRTLNEDESAIVHQNIAKCRATLDWIEQAVDTGKVDMDDALAEFLKGE
ncbi:DUF6192 family protein, partial [Streptomyces sp. NPDC002779]|uniref:DUF6192 family protein n=1 Tax=Streptomyces sp. NPDC002779 TaxID=3364664 RepID=UPI0036C43498